MQPQTAIFDAIAAQQAENVRRSEYERPVLVFVDEINGRLESDYTFGAFLAPVESCFYVRDGRNVSLRPCIWLFAGTRPDPRREAGDKISDFTSRMTLYEQIDFASLKERYKQDEALRTPQMASPDDILKDLYRRARLEQVYIGVSMINRPFPDVRRVSKDVLLGFWKLDPEKSPSRILRKLATGFSNVQYGKITRDNWGNQYDEITRDHIYHADVGRWLREEEGNELVELRFRAAESQV